jgi:hypothetical protein
MKRILRRKIDIRWIGFSEKCQSGSGPMPKAVAEGARDQAA